MPAPDEIATNTPAFSNGTPGAELATATPAYSDTAPGGAQTPGGVPTMNNINPEGDTLQGNVFSQDADSLGVHSDFTFTLSGGHSVVTFTAPFAGRLALLQSFPSAFATVTGLGTVHDENWSATLIPAGAAVTVNLQDAGAAEAEPVGDYLQFNSEPLTSAAPGTQTPVTDWSNSNPGAAATPATGDWSNTAPTALVITGEASPVAGVTAPSWTTVTHAATLNAGTNYFVKVGSRGAPVTITLPDPGSDGQRIEIADTSGQAATHPITVNAGTKTVEGVAATYLVNRNNAVLALAYDGSSRWKIL